MGLKSGSCGICRILYFGVGVCVLRENIRVLLSGVVGLYLFRGCVFLFFVEEKNRLGVVLLESFFSIIDF